MTVEGFSSLIHEVREALDRTPIRSGVYDAIAGHIRVAQFIAEHAKTLDDVRTGISRSVLELGLRNVLTRPELAHAHDPAQRALKVVLSHGDERKVVILPPAAGARAVSSFEVDVGLALVHARDAVEIWKTVDDKLGVVTGRSEEMLEKLEGIATILQRVHDGYAA